MNLTKQQQETLMSTSGVFIVLGIVLVVNLFVNYIPLRFDLTEYKIHTLSKGTKEIVRNIDVPVKMQYFVTDSRELMSAAERNYAKQVENMLIEYEKLNRKNIILEKLNPEPDTDAEEAAVTYGLQQAEMSRGPVFIGLVMKSFEKEEVIPFVHPNREQLLEYDITAALSRVTQDEDTDKPMVTVMTSVEVGGGFSGNFQAPPQQAWYFYEQLERDYQVTTIASDAAEIPEGTDVLVVYHPYDISEAGEYAIDQYLMTGGNIFVIVDPNFWASQALTPQQNPMMGGMPPQGPGQSSDLPTLFESWGVNYTSSQVLGDMSYAFRVARDQTAATVAQLSQDAMNREAVITSQLNDVMLPLPAGFTVDEEKIEESGLALEELLMSSPNNMFFSSFEAVPGEELWQRQDEFAPSGEAKLYAFQLSGKFKSAFPDGNPAGESEPAEPEEGDPSGEEADAEGENEEAKAEEEKQESLTEAVEEGTVIVFGDADFIFEQFALDVFQLGGQRFFQPRNQNLSFFQSVTEYLTGNESLISLRARASTAREFTKLKDMEAKAQARALKTLQDLQKKEEELQKQIEEVLAARAASGEQEIIIDSSELNLDELRRQEVETRG